MSAKASGESVIISLAVLKANWDYKSQAYTESFVPFVAEVLRDSLGAPITLAAVQDGIAARFGLQVPQAALKSILQRAVRRGLARKESQAYVPVADVLREWDLAPARQQVLRKHEALVDRFLEFSRTRFGRELKREEAEASLLAHIEQRTVPLLRSLVEAAPVSHDGTEFTPDQLEYLVGAFIVELAARDPAGFEYLEAIVKGSMLASVLYLPDIGSAAHRFTDLAVYFDTPFLVDALGYTGPAPQASARELLELVYQLGARLACFEDTVTEIHGILSAVASGLRSPRRKMTHVGGVGDYFAQEGMRPSDVELLATRIDRDLKARRIDVVQPPPHANELGVDEAILTALLREHVRYTREDALLHDLDALTAIHRLRKAARFARIENCRALFVTTNDALARAARRFFSARSNGASVPIALLDHELATLAWLKRPMAAPDLPRKQIIADSLAALQPGPEMWKRYIDEIERLQAQGNVTQDDVILLRFSCEAHQALMEGTLGDASAVTPRTVADALSAARAAAAAQALTAAVEAGQHSAAAARRDAEEAQTRAAAAESGAARLRTMLRQDASSKAARRAKVVSAVLFGVIGTAGAAAAILASWPNLPDAFPGWLRFPFTRVVILLCGVLSTATSVLGWVHGTSANAVARSAELWLARRFERILLERLPLEVLQECEDAAVVMLPADPAWTEGKRDDRAQRSGT